MERQKHNEILAARAAVSFPISHSLTLAYKRPVVDGLKSVFSGFTKLYGIITD
jgi:hypothetical protein